MKEMLENIKGSFYLKLVSILFILNFLSDFYWSVKLDSIDHLINGLLNEFTYFLILYALGMIMKRKEEKN